MALSLPSVHHNPIWKQESSTVASTRSNVDILPNTTGTQDIGASGDVWQDIHIGGQINISGDAIGDFAGDGIEVDSNILRVDEDFSFIWTAKHDFEGDWKTNVLDLTSTSSASAPSAVFVCDNDGTGSTGTSTFEVNCKASVNGRIQYRNQTLGVLFALALKTGVAEFTTNIAVDMRFITNDADLIFQGATGIFMTANANSNINMNYLSRDSDFIIEGTSDIHLFYTDASEDRVGISTNSPDTLFHVLGASHLEGAVQIGGDVTFDDTQNMIFSTTGTGTQIGTGSTQLLSFYGATPLVQRTAYTQTYSTANKTHAARLAGTAPAITAYAPPATGGGITVTSIAATDLDTASAALDTLNAEVSSLRDMVENLRLDQTDTAQVVNSIIDDLETTGGLGLWATP